MTFTDLIWSFNDFKKDTIHLFSDIHKPREFDVAVQNMKSFSDFVPIRANMFQDKLRSMGSKSLAGYLEEYGYIDFDKKEQKQWLSSSQKAPYFEEDGDRAKWQLATQIKLDYQLAKKLNEMLTDRNKGIDDDMTDILRI